MPITMAMNELGAQVGWSMMSAMGRPAASRAMPGGAVIARHCASSGEADDEPILANPDGCSWNPPMANQACALGLLPSSDTTRNSRKHTARR
jgi:hypothetical protein